MTHELKTPISTISLAVDALQHPNTKKPEKRDYYASIIKEENKRMDHQLDNVLQMALLEKEKFSIEPIGIDVHQLIEEVVDGSRMLIESKQGSIELQLNAKDHLLVADKIHLGNVIRNLLENAIKYSIDEPAIKINTEDSTQGLRIGINDQGIGMNSETQKHIFDKFYRATKGNLHDTKGFGLGLSYVKAIIEAHGGNIQVDSHINKGSTFGIQIPLDKS
jgi:two-component system phosphate regulon sensor histidine kinase PhoR